ncbi:hypothetical protein PISL3812_04112 [Talaromyces islandicus]|uniref:2EXR domain-containing protein n=1 Tax=Talaromyces islandicus TaxID=28573 RepID=A0A0U1LUL8_TALIS|nr:hypothetical protein PISL3812_04112 [Talaromyces islandicus]
MEAPTLTSSQKPTGFLDLPYEIRLQIYQYCIPQKRCFDVSNIHYRPYRFDPTLVRDSPSHNAGSQELGNQSRSALSEENQSEASESVYDDSSESHSGSLSSADENETKPSDEDQIECIKTIPDIIEEVGGQQSVLPSLLQVSRQISDEALNVLYGDNIFKFFLNGTGQDDLKRVFSDANRRRIQHIILVLRPMGFSYSSEFRMDEVMWNFILPHLIRLCMVAGQPLKNDYYGIGQTLKQKLKRWIEWLTPILECLSKTLSASSTVLDDVDEREETDKLIRGYLHGCQQVRTKTGNLIFRRR